MSYDELDPKEELKKLRRMAGWFAGKLDQLQTEVENHLIGTSDEILIKAVQMKQRMIREHEEKTGKHDFTEVLALAQFLAELQRRMSKMLLECEETVD